MRGTASFAAALVAGAILRAIALPTPGAGDVQNFKTWTYATATAGVTRIYGAGGSPLEHRTFTFLPDLELDIEYPPMSLYELAVVGRIHRAAHGGEFPDTALLTILVKGLPVLRAAPAAVGRPEGLRYERPPPILQRALSAVARRPCVRCPEDRV